MLIKTMLSKYFVKHLVKIPEISKSFYSQKFPYLSSLWLYFSSNFYLQQIKKIASVLHHFRWKQKISISRKIGKMGTWESKFQPKI